MRIKKLTIYNEKDFNEIDAMSELINHLKYYYSSFLKKGTASFEIDCEMKDLTKFKFTITVEKQ